MLADVIDVIQCIQSVPIETLVDPLTGDKEAETLIWKLRLYSAYFGVYLAIRKKYITIVAALLRTAK